jgi:hypothetical protein
MNVHYYTLYYIGCHDKSKLTARFDILLQKASVLSPNFNSINSVDTLYECIITHCTIYIVCQA